MRVKGKTKKPAGVTVYVRRESHAKMLRIAAARKWTQTQVIEEALKAYAE